MGLGGNVELTTIAGADIDSEGATELVAARRYGDWSTRIHALEADGTTKWTRIGPAYGVPWVSPVIGDVDGDGKEEVVCGTSWSSSQLYVLNGENGSDATGWENGKAVGSWFQRAAAVVYLGMSGTPCIVMTNGGGDVRAYTGAGTQSWSLGVSAYQIRATPLLVDIDGDGTMEAVVGCTGKAYVLNIDTTGVEVDSAFCRSVSGAVWSTPAVGDLDADGDLEVVLAGMDSVVYCWDYPGTIWSAGQEWPQVQHDAVRTGRYVEGVPP